MSLIRSALLICTAALLTCPAAATQSALVAPVELSARSLQPDARVSSIQAQAVQDILDRAEASGAVEKAILVGLRDFYAARDYRLLWISSGGDGTRQMRALRRHMDSADTYGLHASLYATPDFALRDTEDPQVRAAADVAFSRTVARFVTHLASGRVMPSEISSIITLEPERPDVGVFLDRLSRTAGVALALSRYEPPQPQYRALKAKLAELRAAGDEPAQTAIADGVTLKPDMPDERLPLLRARLGLAPASADEAELYDPTTVEAVKAFQSANGLTEDGIVGPRTLAVLNGVSREADIAAIAVNMERWRWMPRDLGSFHVAVNVPEYMVRVVDEGSIVHETRVVVGAPHHATPTFSHVMDHLVVNPYWNVPTSIVTNEMLPEIRKNPAGYFARRGYQVLARTGGEMRVVDPNRIEWGMINPRSVRIRQVPGDENALGRIKFMFPNQHSVYLHDTPSKALFRKDYRAYSHGCVRVDNPLDFADALLAVAAPDWDSAKLERLYGGPERRINLDTPIPVHLGYFTRTVDPAGMLRRFEDIYGYDAATEAALSLGS